MGCDIHVQTYVYSKVEKKIVPVISVLEDTYLPDPIVGDRDYNLFGFFGNSFRSWYPESEVLNDGWPEFMKGTTSLAINDNEDSHTVRWVGITELKRGIEDYLERLKDSKKYIEFYNDNNSFVQDIKSGDSSEEEWEQAHEAMISSLKNLQKNVLEYEENIACYDEYLDRNQIYFVTWMDN